MNKQELVEVFKDLHPEDTSGEIIGEVYLDDGTKIQTDSIRIDMDGVELFWHLKNRICMQSTIKIGFKN